MNPFLIPRAGSVELVWSADLNRVIQPGSFSPSAKRLLSKLDLVLSTRCPYDPTLPKGAIQLSNIETPVWSRTKFEGLY